MQSPAPGQLLIWEVLGQESGLEPHSGALVLNLLLGCLSHIQHWPGSHCGLTPHNQGDAPGQAKGGVVIPLMERGQRLPGSPELLQDTAGPWSRSPRPGHSLGSRSPPPPMEEATPGPCRPRWPSFMSLSQTLQSLACSSSEACTPRKGNHCVWTKMTPSHVETLTKEIEMFTPACLPLSHLLFVCWKLRYPCFIGVF